jgi:hypothetical protein
MKATNMKATPLLLAILAITLTIGLVSWDQQQSPGHYGQMTNDTTPKKKSTDKKVRDLDDVLDEIDKADMKLDIEKAQKEIADALKSIDGDKIKLEIERAMKEIDMAKIQQEIRESLAKVDFDKIKTEIADAMKEVDMAKIQQEVKESLAKVDFDKIKLEMEKVKDIDMKKLDADMKKLSEEMKELGPKMEKEMQKAKIEIEKAKVEIKEYKAFVDGLENDGLLNKKAGYTLKHKDGELFINGKQATEQTYNKYRSFLEKHQKFNIEKSDDDFDIDMD